MEKGKATQSSILAWVTKSQIWKWLTAPVFLPGKSHRQRSLEGYIVMGWQEVRPDCMCAPSIGRGQHSPTELFPFTLTGKDWRQEEKGMIEDEMVGWHH